MKTLDQLLIAADCILFIIMVAHFIRMRDLSKKLRAVPVKKKG